ncbi:MAG: hypothetical protein ACI83P_000751 [Janthinobacterium sp.]
MSFFLPECHAAQDFLGVRRTSSTSKYKPEAPFVRPGVLDPGIGAGFVQACRVARSIKADPSLVAVADVQIQCQQRPISALSGRRGMRALQGSDCADDD